MSPGCHSRSHRKRAAWAVVLGVFLAACPERGVTPFPTEYAGIGVELAVRDGGVTVVRVIPGGPASQAGIAAGARILEVDGRTPGEPPLVQTVESLRGPAGSSVTLTLRDQGEPYRVTLQRGQMVRHGEDGGHYLGGRPANAP